MECGSVAGNGLLDGFLGGSSDHFALLFHQVIQKLLSKVPNVRGVHGIFVPFKRSINGMKSLVNQVLENGATGNFAPDLRHSRINRRRTFSGVGKSSYPPHPIIGFTVVSVHWILVMLDIK